MLMTLSGTQPVPRLTGRAALTPPPPAIRPTAGQSRPTQARDPWRPVRAIVRRLMAGRGDAVTPIPASLIPSSRIQPAERTPHYPPASRPLSLATAEEGVQPIFPNQRTLQLSDFARLENIADVHARRANGMRLAETLLPELIRLYRNEPDPLKRAALWELRFNDALHHFEKKQAKNQEKQGKKEEIVGFIPPGGPRVHVRTGLSLTDDAPPELTSRWHSIPPKRKRGEVLLDPRTLKPYAPEKSPLGVGWEEQACFELGQVNLLAEPPTSPEAVQRLQGQLQRQIFDTLLTLQRLHGQAAPQKSFQNHEIQRAPMHAL